MSSFNLFYGKSIKILAIEKNYRLFRIINAFSFYFSSKFRSTCFKNCVETNSYIPMFLALKIYLIKLENEKLTLNELKKIDWISSFKNDTARDGGVSKKIMNKLIKKNWEYNYK